MSYNSNQIISYHLYYVMLYEYPVEIVEVSRFLIKIYNQVAINKKIEFFALGYDFLPGNA